MSKIIGTEKEKIGKNFKCGKNVSIKCKNVIIGNDVTIEDNTTIFCVSDFQIGNLSNIGPNSILKGNSIQIGKEFFDSGYLEIGGGGWYNPNSNLKINDFCVMHNNHINLNKDIFIGKHVGLSPNVDLITHGYWNSILDGFPFKEGPICIDDEVIIGRNSTILPKVTIGKYSVIGAGSIVTKDIPAYSIAVGNPARVIKELSLNKKSTEEKQIILSQIVEEYLNLLAFKNIPQISIEVQYPLVIIKTIAKFDVERKIFSIMNNNKLDIIDDFRDFIRRKGIWFYGRKFKSIQR